MRWIELAPRGAQPGGHIGGDIQVTESFSRRWAKRHPHHPDKVLVIDEAIYGCENNDRRWVQTQLNFYVDLLPRQENLRETEIDLSTATLSHTSYEDDIEDEEARPDWPSEKFLKDQANRWRQPMGFTWNGED